MLRTWRTQSCSTESSPPAEPQMFDLWDQWVSLISSDMDGDVTYLAKTVHKSKPSPSSRVRTIGKSSSGSRVPFLSSHQLKYVGLALLEGCN